MKKIIAFSLFCFMFFGCTSPSKGNKSSGSNTYTVYYYYSGTNTTPTVTEQYPAGSNVDLQMPFGSKCDGNKLVKFVGWSDGTNIYNPGSRITLSSNIHLTLVSDTIQCNAGTVCDKGSTGQCECVYVKRALGEACTSDDDCQSGLFCGTGSKICVSSGN